MSINISLNRIVLVKESSHRYNVNRNIHVPEDAVAVFREVFHADEESQELFMAIYLNVRHAIVGVHLISKGSSDSAVVSPREVFKTALLHNSAAVLVGHNHPSGDVIPSFEDRAITKQLIMAGDLMGIPVLDHIIISDSGYYSFEEKGIMDKEALS